jgi:predicted DNA-binding transcriptional regulator YafY
MSLKVDGKAHIPEKIKFKYLKYSIQNVAKRVERRRGEDYTVSPFCLMVNDGNYYLLSLDHKSGKMRTFRVDRMRNVRFTGMPRCGEDEFKKINLEDYVKEHFGMFPGEREHVTIRFISPLLDTIVDRFGTRGVIYSKDEDGKHMRAVISVAVSDQFFGWLCGFGKRIKIISPSPVVEKFKVHLDKMRSMYE